MKQRQALIFPLLAATFFALFAVSVTAAVDRGLPPPGVAPDQPVSYVGERVYEFFVGIVLTPLDDKTEARYHLGLAGERVAEAQAVVESGSVDKAETAVSRYPGHIREAAKHAISARVEGQRYNTRLLEEVQSAAARHQNGLGGVVEAMPQDDQGTGKNAITAAGDAQSQVDTVLQEAKTE